jgi:hypothetical protein
MSAVVLPVNRRKGDDWAVFSVKDDRERTSIVKGEHRNNRVAEIRVAVADGNRVILHPSDCVQGGSSVAQR